ncbi:MAG: DEAD/DEAH box helicase family protein, partial [Planctomycetes bacterium]|nr:DEAD/DEAH box helicase family protein [Planctomycetota bacterium]
MVEIARRKLARGQRRLHIVAPPGSGKTVLGLYLWAECVRCPALVLSPNSAIQSQWSARVDLFESSLDRQPLASTTAERPALLTSLTYQAVTLPAQGDADLEQLALELWREKLVEADQAKDPAEAGVWIDDLRRHNPDYFEERLATYRKQVRDAAMSSGDSVNLLHRSSRETLLRLKQGGVGLIILDECHHLMGHWGRVLADAHELLDQPIIVGLTATPPDRDGRPPEDVERYDGFFGDVDYEVPVPAIVKDGFLAPYQDLAYFVRPLREELSFIARADEQFHDLVNDLCRPGPAPPRRSDLPWTGEPLSDWLIEVLAERRLPIGVQRDWETFQRRDPALAQAAREFLRRRGHSLPPGTPAPDVIERTDDESEMEILVPLLDRYVRHHLRRSQDTVDHELAESIVARLRTLGVQITETGSRACASPVGRVMAYSRSKTEAVVAILKREHEILGDRLRAIVVADYEKTSAVSAEVSHLLDAEAGGAIAAFRALIRDPDTDRLDPILVTGSSVLVDDDLAEAFDQAARSYLAEHGFDVSLTFGEEVGFHVISGRGADWCPRVYVMMITELFQRGLTRCLVGTRGLLGEGWDANKVNVLIDLTTVTTSMTVNQLRGRSIRLDPDEPGKLANNWEIRRRRVSGEYR